MKTFRKNLNLVTVATLLAASSLAYSMPSYAIPAPYPTNVACLTQIAAAQAKVDMLNAQIAQYEQDLEKFTNDAQDAHIEVVRMQGTVSADNSMITKLNLALISAQISLKTLQSTHAYTYLIAAAQRAVDLATSSLEAMKSTLSIDVSVLKAFQSDEARAQKLVASTQANLQIKRDQLAQALIALADVKKNCK